MSEVSRRIFIGGVGAGGAAIRWWDHFGGLKVLHKRWAAEQAAKLGVGVKWTYNEPGKALEALQLAKQANQLLDIYSNVLGIPLPALVDVGWLHPIKLSKEAMARLPKGHVRRGRQYDRRRRLRPAGAVRPPVLGLHLVQLQDCRAGRLQAAEELRRHAHSAEGHRRRRQVRADDPGARRERPHEGPDRRPGAGRRLPRLAGAALRHGRVQLRRRHVPQRHRALQGDLGQRLAAAGQQLVPDPGRARPMGRGQRRLLHRRTVATRWGGCPQQAVPAQDGAGGRAHPRGRGADHHPRRSGRHLVHGRQQRQPRGCHPGAGVVHPGRLPEGPGRGDGPTTAKPLDTVAKADVIEPYRTLIADFKKRVFRAPQPQVRKAEVSKALALTTPIAPHLGDLIQGYLGGNITNLKGELVKLSDKFSRDLDSAIKKANAKGADVSRADFEFSDWKRGKDYTYS